jgi:thioredoxin reductase (NADPH)
MRNQNQPSSTLGRIRLFGNRDSAEAWQIRDFLKRSAVEFDWVELTGDTDCQNALGLPSLKNVRLPVVELPEGERLYGPSLKEVAASSAS